MKKKNRLNCFADLMQLRRKYKGIHFIQNEFIFVHFKRFLLLACLYFQLSQTIQFYLLPCLLVFLRYPILMDALKDILKT